MSEAAKSGQGAAASAAETLTAPTDPQTPPASSPAAAVTPAGTKKTGTKKAKAPKARAAASDTSESAGSAEIDTVSIQIPKPGDDVSGYMSSSFDVSLSGDQATTLKRIGHGLRDAGATINSAGDTIRRLLDLIGKQLPATAPTATEETPAE